MARLDQSTCIGCPCSPVIVTGHCRTNDPAPLVKSGRKSDFRWNRGVPELVRSSTDGVGVETGTTGERGVHAMDDLLYDHELDGIPVFSPMWDAEEPLVLEATENDATAAPQGRFATWVAGLGIVELVGYSVSAGVLVSSPLIVALRPGPAAISLLLASIAIPFILARTGRSFRVRARDEPAGTIEDLGSIDWHRWTGREARDELAGTIEDRETPNDPAPVPTDEPATAAGAGPTADLGGYDRIPESWSVGEMSASVDLPKPRDTHSSDRIAQGIFRLDLQDYQAVIDVLERRAGSLRVRLDGVELLEPAVIPAGMTFPIGRVEIKADDPFLLFRFDPPPVSRLSVPIGQLLSGADTPRIGWKPELTIERGDPRGETLLPKVERIILAARVAEPIRHWILADVGKSDVGGFYGLIALASPIVVLVGWLISSLISKIGFPAFMMIIMLLFNLLIIFPILIGFHVYFSRIRSTLSPIFARIQSGLFPAASTRSVLVESRAVLVVSRDRRRDDEPSAIL